MESTRVDNRTAAEKQKKIEHKNVHAIRSYIVVATN